MAESLPSSPFFEAHRAVGRCFGAIFFAVFGAAWLTLALYAFGSLHRASFLLLVMVVAGVVTLALRLLAIARSAAAREPVDPRRKRDHRTFAWINAAQGLVIFLLMATLPRLGHQDIAITAVVIVVGLHFLVLPPAYRHRSNFVLGVSMVAWGLLCLLLFHGGRMIVMAALGSGLMLWSLAAFALHTASSVVRRLSR